MFIVKLNFRKCICLLLSKNGETFKGEIFAFVGKSSAICFYEVFINSHCSLFYKFVYVAQNLKSNFRYLPDLLKL